MSNTNKIETKYLQSLQLKSPKMESKKSNSNKQQETFIPNVRSNTQFQFILQQGTEKSNKILKETLAKPFAKENRKWLAEMLAKIKLIKQLEDILDINISEIDTNIHVKRFEEEIEVNDEIKSAIKNLFRSNRDLEEITFKNWYYQLIQMYKNIVGDNILLSKRKYYHGLQHMSYIFNKINIFEKNRKL